MLAFGMWRCRGKLQSSVRTACSRTVGTCSVRTHRCLGSRTRHRQLDAYRPACVAVLGFADGHLPGRPKLGNQVRIVRGGQRDGAGQMKQFTAITLPQLSPIIFFNLVMSVINSFQTFTQAYVALAARAAQG